VPVLISMSLTAILLLPKLAASTYGSGSHIVSSIPDQAGGGQILPLLASIVRLFALALPVLGTVLMAQRLVRTYATKARGWSADHPARRAAVVAATAALVGLMAWAWWPSGQYQPVRATDHGTLLSVGQLVSAPATVARPELGVTTASASSAPVSVAPGRHMAVALIPVGGATKAHPAIFVIKGKPGEKSAVIVTDDPPKTTSTPTFEPGTGSAAAAAAPAPAATATPAGSAPTPAPATAFPFILPKKPGPNDSQALATNSTDGGIKYDVVYSLVTVKGGDTVDETNSAYALASCKACMTVAVSFQLVLIVGQSDTITPINVAEALNVNCPSCITTAIASQIVVTLKALPSDELLRRLTEELKKLDAISQLGANGTPANVAKSVQEVQDEIDQELSDSGLMTNPPPPKAASTATPQASSTPGSNATPEPSATPGATPTPTPTPTLTATVTPTATATPSPTATDTPSAADATPMP
jgi:putative peptide zinc metalloprotease protein